MLMMDLAGRGSNHDLADDWDGPRSRWAFVLAATTLGACDAPAGTMLSVPAPGTKALTEPPEVLVVRAGAASIVMSARR
jgi:hypothetical protein